MANIVTDPGSLPDHAPIPGAKPPITAFPFHDEPGDPQEVDEFLTLIRELRHGVRTASK